MLKFRKIFITILIFVIVLMLICVFYSIHQALNSNIEMSQILDEAFKYFLYTIGYGNAVEGEDSISQNIFAMIGIISIALMTTYLTLNLFWRGDDVKISNKIAIWKRKGDFYASILFSNEGNDICDLKASFISYDANGNIVIKENKDNTYPLLVKKSYWRLEIPIKEIFWYKSLRAMTEGSVETYIYLTFSFVDTKNGQSSIKVIKYGKNDLLGLKKANELSTKNTNKLTNNTKVLAELKEMLLKNTEQYDVSKLQQVENGGTISLSYNESEACEDAKINFPSNASNDKFVMALFLNKDNIVHFERFYSKEALFRCVLSGDEGVKHVTLQIKKEDKSIILEKKMEIKEKPTTYEYKLEEMIPSEYKNNEEDYLNNIGEICFTTFKEGMCKENALLKIYKAEVDSGNVIFEKIY